MEQICKDSNGKYGVQSWTDGFRSYNHDTSLKEEAMKNPEAVINRYMREGDAEELAGNLAASDNAYKTAEDIMDRYV